MASGSSDSIDLTKLKENKRFKWVIKDHAVVATWHEEMEHGRQLRYLGDRKPHNEQTRQTPSLQIWIGQDGDNRQLLIVLAFQIKLRSSSKQVPRNMYLVVPAASLRITCTAPTFGELIKQGLPSTLVEHPSDKASADSARILHIALSLGDDASSQVIMPKAKSKRATIGQPLNLLQAFRSLSHTREINVYMNYNTYAHVGLETLSTKLEKNIVTTPSIDLSSMYARTGGGSINNWSAQGLSESHDMSPPSKPREPSPIHAPRAVISDQPPPPYSTRVDFQTIISRSCTPSSPMSSSDAGSCVPETPLPQLHRPGKRLCTSLRPPINDALSGVSEDMADAPQLVSTRPAVNTPILVEPSPSAQARLPVVYTPLATNVPLPKAHATLPVDGPPPAANMPLPIAESAMSAGSPHPTSMSQSVNAHLTSGLRLANASNQVESLSIRISLELSDWLVKAWTTCPYAHFVFVTNLLRIGAAAHEQDEALYARERAESTANLLYYNAQKHNDRSLCSRCSRCSRCFHGSGMDTLCRTGRKATAAVREEAVKQETVMMILWMNIIFPTADLLFMRLCLARWAEKGVRLVNFDRPEDLDAYTTLLKDFNKSKALCVAETCFFLGRDALASVDKIVARMRQEVI